MLSPQISKKKLKAIFFTDIADFTNKFKQKIKRNRECTLN